MSRGVPEVAAGRNAPEGPRGCRNAGAFGLTMDQSGGISARSLELALFSGALQGRGGGVGSNGGAHHVEVAGAGLALVLDSSEALFGRRELALLQLDIGGHAVAGVTVRQVEHAVVERVEARQGDELELKAHVAQFALELGDSRVVQMCLPVEGR